MFRLAIVATLPRSRTSDCSGAWSLDQRVVETPSIAYLGANAAACWDDAVARAIGSAWGTQLVVSAASTPSAVTSRSVPHAGTRRTRARTKAEVFTRAPFGLGKRLRSTRSEPCAIDPR